MNNNLFSIIIPTYNRANFIEGTIQSVLNQGYSNFELIVIDDGSTDNTEEIVNNIKDPRLKYYKKENAERGAARNFGIKHAKGDYITLLDSDDLFYDNHLEKANDFILGNDNVKVLFQGYEILQNNKAVKCIFPGKNINKILLQKGNVMSCHGVFIKDEIIKQNLFSEDIYLSGIEDYELWLRISAQYQIDHNPIVTSCLINHDERSVLEVNKNKLIKRNELFLKYLFENETINDYILPYKNILEANTLSYVALHLILSGYKKESLKFIFSSIRLYPKSILSRRFLAIIKHFIY